MLDQCHDNQETKTCFDIVETTSTSREKLSSYGLEHEKKIFSLVDPLKCLCLYVYLCLNTYPHTYSHSTYPLICLILDHEPVEGTISRYIKYSSVGHVMCH